MVKEIVILDVCSSEIQTLSSQTNEALFHLVRRFISGERLDRTVLKIFWLDHRTKIQEFRIRDEFGNWRAISFISDNDFLVLVHVFHKKTQHISMKTRRTILSRIKGAKK